MFVEIKQNLGKVWVNNGKISKLLSKDLLYSNEYKEFKFLGRIEKPRKKRGSYNVEKKTFVNNGNTELKIPISKVNEFLKNNSQYKRGRK